MAEDTRLPPPEDLRAAVEQSKSIGMMLYLRCMISAIGVAVVRENMRAPEELGIADYVTLENRDEDECWQVTFLSAGSLPRALYRVRISMQDLETPEFSVLDPRTRLPDDIRRMSHAQRVALAAVRPTAQLHHPVILPGWVIGKSGIVVYLLAWSLHDDIAVLGKHHRVLMSSDGKIAMSVESLSSTLVEVPLAALRLAVPGSRDPWISHLSTAWPLETDVFVSLWHKTPVYVRTSRGHWMVDGTRISLLPALESPSRSSRVLRQPAAGASPQRAALAPSLATAIEPVPSKPWWRFW